jgi:hypothetical protein
LSTPERAIFERLDELPNNETFEQVDALFDARNLLAIEGITDDLRQAFIVYLLSHDRPMSEVLAPTLKRRCPGLLNKAEAPVRSIFTKRRSGNGCIAAITSLKRNQ